MEGSSGLGDGGTSSESARADRERTRGKGGVEEVAIVTKMTSRRALTASPVNRRRTLLVAHRLNSKTFYRSRSCPSHQREPWS